MSHLVYHIAQARIADIHRDAESTRLGHTARNRGRGPYETMLSMRRLAITGALAAATLLGGCGGGGSATAVAKVGDCIDSSSQVVDCSSPSAAQKLVSDQSAPDAIACIQIGAAPQSEVTVEGTAFCAEPNSTAGTTTTAETTTAGSSPGGEALKHRYEHVFTQMKATAVAAATAVHDAGAYTNTELAKMFIDLSAHWQIETTHLTVLEAPETALAEVHGLVSAAANVEGDMHQMIGAASTGNAGLAKRVAGALLHDLLATKNAAAKLERKL